LDLSNYERKLSLEDLSFVVVNALALLVLDPTLNSGLVSADLDCDLFEAWLP
jgi:hypothetical protein